VYNQYDYYFKFKKRPSEDKLFGVLKSSKFSLFPIFEGYETDFKHKIKKFGFTSSEKVIEQTGWTIFTNNRNILIIFQYAPGGFDIRIITDKEDAAIGICKLLSKIEGVVDYKKGKLKDNELIQHLNKQLKTLSPNGKALKNATLGTVISKIVSCDKLRVLVKKIADTYGNLPLSFEQLNTLNIDKSELNNLINDANLVQKNHKIICAKCKQPSEFLFEYKVDAEKSLKKAKYSCPKCGNNKTGIIEYYSLTKNALAALKQGIWLEKLCLDTISRITNNYWSGYYVDTNELDGVTVFSGNIILVECKDTSFGQNELYIAMVKAEDVKANIVLIVTTNPVHNNVEKLILKYEKQGKRKFRIISSNNAEEIVKGLSKFFVLKQTNDILGLIDNRSHLHPRNKSYRETFTNDLEL